jgi:hypothetical protein
MGFEPMNRGFADRVDPVLSLVSSVLDSTRQHYKQLRSAVVLLSLVG